MVEGGVREDKGDGRGEKGEDWEGKCPFEMKAGAEGRCPVAL